MVKLNGQFSGFEAGQKWSVTKIWTGPNFVPHFLNGLEMGA